MSIVFRNHVSIMSIHRERSHMKSRTLTTNAFGSFRNLALWVGLIAGSLLLVACGEKAVEAPKAVIRPVKTITVKAGGGVAGLQLPGKVRASKRVDLAFKEVGGRLLELPIAGKEGTRVKKGDLLARIDPKDFKTNLRNIQGRLKQAEASLSLAKKEYARVKRIRDKDPGAISGADLDRKMEAVNDSQGRIKSLKASVDDAKNKLINEIKRTSYKPK